jgi:uncharacterized coiled-coil DUF342 family protein
MLDFFFKPLRSLLGVAEHEVESVEPIAETEKEILDAVKALDDATKSIEHHVEVIEQLATSVDPLKDSVNSLNATMVDLVKVLAPLAAAEREAGKIEHFFGRHRHQQPATDPTTAPDPGRE